MTTRLCYVINNKAYFTTKELSKQWGDDWDDAPYEYNASTPYEPYQEEDDWEIIKLHFEVSDFDCKQPCDGVNNSRFSVKTINAGAVPWLSFPKSGESVRAGASIREFTDAIKDHEGTVYYPSNFDFEKYDCVDDKFVSVEREFAPCFRIIIDEHDEGGVVYVVYYYEGKVDATSGYAYKDKKELFEIILDENCDYDKFDSENTRVCKWYGHKCDDYVDLEDLYEMVAEDDFRELINAWYERKYK